MRRTGPEQMARLSADGKRRLKYVELITNEKQELARKLSVVESRQASAVYEALAAGVPATVVARASCLSISRVYQLRDLVRKFRERSVAQ